MRRGFHAEVIVVGGGPTGFGNVKRGWTLQLRVENLTDQATNCTAEEVALATGVIAEGTNSPRIVMGELRWEF